MQPDLFKAGLATALVGFASRTGDKGLETALSVVDSLTEKGGPMPNLVDYAQLIDAPEVDERPFSLHLIEYLEQVDSYVFSSPELHGVGPRAIKRREAFRAYLSRWARELALLESAAQEDFG